MDELISKAQVIDALHTCFRDGFDEDKWWNSTHVLAAINGLPSAEEESFEWCTGCKEYDQEKHCCHRFTNVIRRTVDELQIIRCKDCIYADYMDDVKTFWCSEGGGGKTVAPEDFCSYGERKEVTE